MIHQVHDGDSIVVPVGDVAVNIAVTVAQGIPTGIPLATEFRLPMKHIEKAWYNADEVYGPYTYHPARCVDRNLESGGATDWNEPLVAPFSGIVLTTYDWYGAIGGAVQIMGVSTVGEIIVWCGWHVNEITALPGAIVYIGEDIATIGSAHDKYSPHLHEQIVIANKFGIPGPTVYPSDDRYGWQQPDAFYIAHGVDPATVNRCRRKDNA